MTSERPKDDMAASVLANLTANNLFDLTGVVAVVTGGGKASTNDISLTVHMVLILERLAVCRALG